MKRHTVIALAAALALPAAALADTDRFKGDGRNVDNVEVKFQVKNEKKVEQFTVNNARFKCDGSRGKFRADPPKFDDDMKISRRGNEFGDDFEDVSTGDSGEKVKFKGKVDGKLEGKGEDGDRGEFRKGRGKVRFIVNYVADRERCETERIQWRARRR